MKRRHKEKRIAFVPPTTGWEKFVVVSCLHFRDAPLDEATCEDCEDRITGQCVGNTDIFYCMVEKSKRLEFSTNSQGRVMRIKED